MTAPKKISDMVEAWKKGPIERHDYLMYLKDAESAFALKPFPIITAIIERLYADNDGLALAGVNQLRRMKIRPQETLRATIESTFFATGAADLVPHLKHQEAEAEKNAEDVLRFANGPAKGYSRQLDHSLEGLHEYWLIRAGGCRAGAAMLFLPRYNTPNAEVKTALRHLRDTLFPSRKNSEVPPAPKPARAPNLPLQRLITVALGYEFSDATVKEALRKDNSIEVQAKHLSGNGN